MPVLRRLLLLALVAAVSACGTTGERTRPADGVAGGAPGGQKVGRPYQVAGIWYYPEVDHDYDAVGLASWYGPRFHGKPTANGETFDMNRLTAAHTTLPLPSRVRVTNLDNGRTLALRVNDRGPFVPDRIIDVSRRAAQLLGFERQGTARVRVQVIRPDGSIADNGGRSTAARRLAAGEVPAGPLFVQVGAFSEYDNALALRRRLSDLGDVSIQTARANQGTVYRVRIGPFHESTAAERMLRRVFERGFYGARIFTDRLG